MSHFSGLSGLGLCRSAFDIQTTSFTVIFAARF